MKIRHIILILGFLFAVWMSLFIYSVLDVWGSEKKEVEFNELSNESQAAIVLSTDWRFSENEHIEIVQYIRYGNDVEEIIVRIKTEDIAQFMDRNEKIRNYLSEIDPGELATGDTGYYSDGNALFVAIQIRDYSIIKERTDEIIYIDNLARSLSAVFEDTEAASP